MTTRSPGLRSLPGLEATVKTGVCCCERFMINRRQFISAAAAASTASLVAQQSYEWGGPVLDIHLHLRADGESDFAHIEGSGVTRAVLLTRVQAVDQAKALAEKHRGRFVWFVSADVTK